MANPNELDAATIEKIFAYCEYANLIQMWQPKSEILYQPLSEQMGRLKVSDL